MRYSSEDDAVIIGMGLRGNVPGDVMCTLVYTGLPIGTHLLVSHQVQHLDRDGGLGDDLLAGNILRL